MSRCLRKYFKLRRLRGIPARSRGLLIAHEVSEAASAYLPKSPTALPTAGPTFVSLSAKRRRPAAIKAEILEDYRDGEELNLLKVGADRR
jgi:hypothetical protein